MLTDNIKSICSRYAMDWSSSYKTVKRYAADILHELLASKDNWPTMNSFIYLESVALYCLNEYANGRIQAFISRTSTELLNALLIHQPLFINVYQAQCTNEEWETIRRRLYDGFIASYGNTQQYAGVIKALSMPVPDMSKLHVLQQLKFLINVNFVKPAKSTDKTGKLNYKTMIQDVPLNQIGIKLNTISGNRVVIHASYGLNNTGSLMAFTNFLTARNVDPLTEDAVKNEFRIAVPSTVTLSDEPIEWITENADDPYSLVISYDTNDLATVIGKFTKRRIEQIIDGYCEYPIAPHIIRNSLKQNFYSGLRYSKLEKCELRSQYLNLRNVTANAYQSSKTVKELITKIQSSAKQLLPKYEWKFFDIYIDGMDNIVKDFEYGSCMDRVITYVTSYIYPDLLGMKT